MNRTGLLPGSCFFREMKFFSPNILVVLQKPIILRLQNLIKVLDCGKSSCNGGVPEWPNGADCKSADLCLRWFESIRPHSSAGIPAGFTRKCGSSSAGRAIAFQAIGREFEPRLPLHSESKPCPIERACFWGLSGRKFTAGKTHDYEYNAFVAQG